MFHPHHPTLLPLVAEESVPIITTTRTILRIKRRRTEDPISCLRLEGVSRIPTDVGDDDTESIHNNYKKQQDDVEKEEQNYYHLQQQHSHEYQQTFTMGRKRSSSAVLWKRYDPNNNNNSLSDPVGDDNKNVPNRYRIVNAMFTDDDDYDDDTLAIRHRDRHPEGSRTTKRRKLTLLDTSTATSSNNSTDHDKNGSTCSNNDLLLHSILGHTSMDDTILPSNTLTMKKKIPLKILDPLTRIVDDSLQEVLTGSRTVQAHYRMLTTDPRLVIGHDSTTQRKWLTWCHSSGGGNLLHCCALWNDPSTAQEILQQHQNQQQPQQPHYCFGDHPQKGFAGCYGGGKPHSNNNAMLLLIATLTETMDGDGRTPYEVAQVLGHEPVCRVLEAYGGDTSNFVYDVFLLDDEQQQQRRRHKRKENENDLKNEGESGVYYSREEYDRSLGVDDDDYDDADPRIDNDNMNPYSSNNMMTAELTSGVGYWTPDGELVLEADERHARSLSHETDGDIDSNCEEYGANDYPEEGEDEDDNSISNNRDNHHFSNLQPWQQYPLFSEELQQYPLEEYQGRDGEDAEDFNRLSYRVSMNDDDDDDSHYDEYDWEDDLQTDDQYDHEETGI